MNLRRLMIHSVSFLLIAEIIAAGAWAYDSATNGAYGGYVGSDQWFSSMRQSAANRAMLQSLGGSRTQQKVPADYIEFAGQIEFPQGNPFPQGRIPDLRILSRDRAADPVERVPHVDKDGSFYTVLRKGQTYDLYWMYYFGSREKFASVHIRPEGAGRRKAIFTYVPKHSAEDANRRDGRSGASTQTGSGYTAPKTSTYQAPQVGPSYNPPKVGPGYTPPQTGTYQSPKVGPGYIAPKTGPGYQQPGSN